MLITQIQGKKPSELARSQIQHLTFDKIRKKWIIEDSEDQSYEYDEILERWVPTAEGEKHKRDSDDPEEAKLALKRMKKEEIEKKKLEKQNRRRPNTSIYVTGMPKDISVEELKDTFGRCGVIAEDLKTGKPRIKMYEDENGQFKGDCLIRYFRAESCDLAMEILDGTKIRPGDGEEMKISMAVFDEERTVKKEPLKFKDKLNVKKRIKEMNDRLADWSDSDSEEDRRRKRRKEYVVVLKHCFTLDELKEDPLAISDIK
ncbi:DEKNAAC103465, partial [Brettanomyces naardenensis]